MNKVITIQIKEADLINIIKRIEQGSLTALRNGTVSKAEALLKLHDDLKAQSDKANGSK